MADDVSVALERYVYALGHIRPRFPSLGVEKEYAQLIGHVEKSSPAVSRDALPILQQRKYRYLARQLCYVLTVQDVEAFILKPRVSDDFATLLELALADDGDADVHVVIGNLGPAMPSGLCNGVLLPLVLCEALLYFDGAALLPDIMRANEDRPEFEPLARTAIAQFQQMSGNVGIADEHRVANFLTVRYPGVYSKIAQQLQHSRTLIGVELRPSRLAGLRKIYHAILVFGSNDGGTVQRFSAKVDVTDMFPFLVSPMTEYFDR